MPQHSLAAIRYKWRPSINYRPFPTVLWRHSIIPSRKHNRSRTTNSVATALKTDNKPHEITNRIATIPKEITNQRITDCRKIRSAIVNNRSVPTIIITKPPQEACWIRLRRYYDGFNCQMSPSFLNGSFDVW